MVDKVKRLEEIAHSIQTLKDEKDDLITELKEICLYQLIIIKYSMRRMKCGYYTTRELAEAAAVSIKSFDEKKYTVTVEPASDLESDISLGWRSFNLDNPGPFERRNCICLHPKHADGSVDFKAPARSVILSNDVDAEDVMFATMLIPSKYYHATLDRNYIFISPHSYEHTSKDKAMKQIEAYMK